MNESKLQIFTNTISLFEKSIALFSGKLEKPSWSGYEHD